MARLLKQIYYTSDDWNVMQGALLKASGKLQRNPDHENTDRLARRRSSRFSSSLSGSSCGAHCDRIGQTSWVVSRNAWITGWIARLAARSIWKSLKTSRATRRFIAAHAESSLAVGTSLNSTLISKAGSTAYLKCMMARSFERSDPMRIDFEDDPENDLSTLPNRYYGLILCIGIALAVLITWLAYLELSDPMFL
jgi:hypothetical protein